MKNPGKDAGPQKPPAVRSTPQPLLTQRELAKLLRCTVQTVCRKTALGELPVHRIGRKPLYDWQEVLAATRTEPLDDRIQETLTRLRLAR